MKNPSISGFTACICLIHACSSASAAVISHGDTSIEIAFVDIGYADNNADTSGFGSVAYDYLISKYEITSNDWLAVTTADSDIETGSASDPHNGLQPTSEVSWYEAAKFANWLTSGDALSGAYKFSDSNTFISVDRDSAADIYQTIYVLPTEDEWYKAAYYKSDGSGYTAYATGDTIPVSGTDANYRATVGSPAGAAWSVGDGTEENNGTYDMGGNIWEWTESAYDGELNDPDEIRALRGGYYGNILQSLRSDKRIGPAPDGEVFSTGFRLASISIVPEPSSTALLSLGSLAVFMRRRRD
ncbi:MAG: SUMF1/EgtB/PvdO family nonheme iron enzyme [Akkermansiaceae bacterium]|nr:SUMF1/EgtB/PvdO family nonheme iron enzyme [Akkermansiaceae bacterium]